MAGYKISTQASLLFLYTNNELAQRETKKAIPFIITRERIKYLGINLTKEVKGLCKTLMKEIEDNTKKLKVSYTHGLEESTLLKCPCYLKQPTDSMQSLLESR